MHNVTSQASEQRLRKGSLYCNGRDQIKKTSRRILEQTAQEKKVQNKYYCILPTVYSLHLLLYYNECDEAFPKA